MKFLANRGIAIVGCAQTGLRRNSGLTALELAGEVFLDLLRTVPIDRRQIDGFACTPAISDAGNLMWSHLLLETLGLQTSWCQLTEMGGASNVGNIARAAMAIESGLCETVLCISADAVSTAYKGDSSGRQIAYCDAQGLSGPLTTFGLLSDMYAQQYGYPMDALARLAVSQRSCALANEKACEELRHPIGVEDYKSSRIVSAPLRLLDCVMRCDGATAILLTKTSIAQRMGVRSCVHPIAYRELSNFDPAQERKDILASGFSVIGPAVLQDAGIGHSQVNMFHPYDDFLIAVLMQLEQMGFCASGQAGKFIMENDIGPAGSFPINTGGGQISCGQPGYAGGSVNLCEALTQLLGTAGSRQVSNATNALVTGLGVIPYARNWGASNALVLERG